MPFTTLRKHTHWAVQQAILCQQILKTLIFTTAPTLNVDKLCNRAPVWIIKCLAWPVVSEINRTMRQTTSTTDWNGQLSECHSPRCNYCQQSGTLPFVAAAFQHAIYWAIVVCCLPFAFVVVFEYAANCLSNSRALFFFFFHCLCAVCALAVSLLWVYCWFLRSSLLLDVIMPE